MAKEYTLTREQLCTLLDLAYLSGYHCGWDGKAEEYVDDMLAELEKSPD